MNHVISSDSVARPIRLVHVFTVATSLDFLRGQVRYVSSQGFQVHLVAAPDGDLMARFADSEGATAHEVPMTRSLTPLRDLRSLVAVWRIIRVQSPDIVHASTPKGGLLGILAASVHRVPVRIYHMHGIRGMTMTGWRRMLLMTAEWLTCRLASQVLCVSQSARMSAVEARLCAPEKIVVLGAGSCNGVDAGHRFNPDQWPLAQTTHLRRQLGIPEGCPVVGFIGRVVREKGIVELAGAWQQLATDYPNGYLLIIGPLEEGDPVPIETLNMLRAHHRVRFVEKIDDPAPYYAIMDVVALPTHREGLPNVPLEAAAMRVPVVATRVTGCVDAIVDGQTGTLVPPFSPEQLAKAISTYLASPNLARQHGTNGRHRVLKDFVPQHLWERVVDLYRSSLSRVGPSRLDTSRP